MDEGKFGTKIISTDALLSGNQKEIQDLLLQIAQQHDVDIKDAANALKNVLNKYIGGTSPNEKTTSIDHIPRNYDY